MTTDTAESAPSGAAVSVRLVDLLVFEFFSASSGVRWYDHSGDLGAMHRNPCGDRVGPTHKHRWTDEFRDKLACAPEDITASWDQPVQVWQQFCDESLIAHDGVLDRPVWQEELLP